MLLLYQSIPSVYVFAAAPFTFHYASTLSEGAEYIAAFNQMTFTFHYASTLSRKPSSHSRPLYNDLHSTMLLLYRTAQGLLPASAARIYIPLCFYFIGSRSALPPGWSVNLHSTMLLLYPSSSSSLFQRFLIYIPLCFYFINNIYPFHSSLWKFTFHYASTLSLSPLSNGIGYPSFTFHYASTLSVPVKIVFKSSKKFTFHYASTLSCTFTSSPTSKSVFTFHYASTLSRRHDGGSWENRRFTFHYASTLSE